MIVHLTTSRQTAVRHIETMRKMVTIIHQMGHVLSRDWLEPFYIMTRKGIEDLTPEEIFKLNINAIDRADLVIVEGSERSFGSGFQVATALHKKKPTLLLINAQHKTNESNMSRGLSDPLLTHKIYDDRNLATVIKHFIDENMINTKDLRFNFVIDRHIYHYLRRKAHSAQKTKAEIVRELLVREIEKED